MRLHFIRLYQVMSNRILRTVISIVNYINNLKIKILVNNGLEIGENTFIGNNVAIDPVFPWMISIGSGCVLTNGVIILAHDSSLENRFGCGKVGKVLIGKNTFVGVKSIILPGVQIGENVIIGAGSVVTTDIPDNCVAVGNPARVICSTFEYLEKHQKNMEVRPVYESCYVLNNLDFSVKQVMKEELRNGIGYFRADPKTQNCFSQSSILNNQSSFDHRK